jgi:murein DD-endopeptidase MepM/ murein hydrolase activator NlpD
MHARLPKTYAQTPAELARIGAQDRLTVERSRDAVMVRLAALAAGMALAFGASAQTALPELPPSSGAYRLPFADGTSVKVFDDFYTHRPRGRVDLYAVGGPGPFKVVAAAAGRIVAIQDSFNEQQSGRAAADCHNNYVWIAHPNGEWTNYSHLAHNSVTLGARLKIGDHVAAGAYLGDEDAIGCAMLKHVHFEVAVPNARNPIDAGGFLTDNDSGQRERNPKFCGVPDGVVRKDSTYQARGC